MRMKMETWIETTASMGLRLEYRILIKLPKMGAGHPRLGKVCKRSERWSVVGNDQGQRVTSWCVALSRKLVNSIVSDFPCCYPYEYTNHLLPPPCLVFYLLTRGTIFGLGRSFPALRVRMIFGVGFKLRRGVSQKLEASRVGA